MPSTTIVILESGRRIDSQLRRASENLPVWVRGARTIEELSLRLRSAPQAIAVIHHPSKETARAVRVASANSAAVFVIAEPGASDVDMTEIRLAGATGIFAPLASMDRWRAWVRRVVAENQLHLSAAGGIRTNDEPC